MRMRRGKLRPIIVLATVAVLMLTLLPSTVVAHETCRFYGPVRLCGENVPPGTVVSAWLEDPYIGPWNATMYYHRGGQTWYYVDVPWDNPGTPGKEGGVEGETVFFNVTYNSITLAAPNATWERVGFIYHPLLLCDPCPLQGDVNMDGEVNVGDIIKEKRIIKGLDPPTPCADVNHDGSVDVGDIIKIKRIIKGIDC